MAKISVKKVTKDIEVVVKEKRVVNADINLTLTLEEALSLVFVLGNVGGNPENTCRQYTDSIADKLQVVNSMGSYPSNIIESPFYSLYFNSHSLVELKKYVEHYLSKNGK